jgi:hypothetical protein
MKIFIFLLALAISFISNAESLESAADIQEFTANFKTFNGKKLVSLLNGYGLKIESVEIDKIESLNPLVRKKGDRNGDLVVSMHIMGKVKKMPCGLNKWLLQGMSNGNAEDVSEIIYRKGEFLLTSPELNPLLYWAGTGKCSADYGLPM